MTILFILDGYHAHLIHVSTHLDGDDMEMESNYKYPSESKTIPRYLRSVACQGFTPQVRLYVSLRARKHLRRRVGRVTVPTEEKPRGALTLDVDGDAGLLAVGDGLVGGLADDLLARLDVGWRQVERAHRALPPAVAEQRLRKKRQKQKVEQKLKSCRGGRGCGDEII